MKLSDLKTVADVSGKVFPVHPGACIAYQFRRLTFALGHAAKCCKLPGESRQLLRKAQIRIQQVSCCQEEKRLQRFHPAAKLFPIPASGRGFRLSCLSRFGLFLLLCVEHSHRVIAVIHIDAPVYQKLSGPRRQPFSLLQIVIRKGLFFI